jgi:predicted RecB family nuclease
MKLERRQLTLSATDLARHLACRHLTMLDLRAARGEIERPYRNDPGLDALIERGFRHEAEYLDHLRRRGLGVSQQPTLEAMKSGADVIVQADLQDGHWFGRADVLLRVDTPSNLGDWSYEVVDTKLARETRGGTILQLCHYTELVHHIQGIRPARMHVIAPGRNFEPETFRPTDYLAYYRYVKTSLENFITTPTPVDTYPEPVEQCDVCSWWTVCNERRRKDDHLSFVAGVSKLQMAELDKWNVTTLSALGGMPLPLQKRPERGAVEGYVKAREQARLQLCRRTTGKPLHELLALEPERGLARLPEPSTGDIFLDFEADPFVDDGGIEYLLGYFSMGDYTLRWSFNRASERATFEAFIDFVVQQRERFPDLHVYHFSHYEPTALKRLMGRYATREDEVDRLLRAGVFVDLYGILKQTLRASVERYSLKDLEIFFGFDRKTDLRDARKSLTTMECALELGEVDSLSPEVLQTVESYNREDCVSAFYLRDWLEGIRRELIDKGNAINRLPLESGDPPNEVDVRRKRAVLLMERLLEGNPEPARKMLAHMIEWHRREEKAPWWEYFRLRRLTDDELLEERDGLAGLTFVKRVGGTALCPIDRYQFPSQDTQIREGDSVETSKGKFGSVESIDNTERTIEIKKRKDTAGLHPSSIFSHEIYTGYEQAESLYRIGSWVATNGIDAPGRYRAGRDLLLRLPPRVSLAGLGSNIVDEARRLVLLLDREVLPIQGPPGSGKTYTAARMICTLLAAGKKAGITAVSHRVIRKVLEEVLNVANKEEVDVRCIEKVAGKPGKLNPALMETGKNERVLQALQAGEANIAAGTSWMWAREEFEESVDVLFVDEAGQMSLADVVAVSPAAKNVVLLGDPLQLDQPLQGTHPPGIEVSALQHVLGESETMPTDRGLFLAETWRLAPPICRFTSELFYEGRLTWHTGLELQKVTWPDKAGSVGLWFVPVEHTGNQSSSNEELSVVQHLVAELTQSGVTWTTMEGEQRAVTLDDILIVSPYNAQVFNLAGRMPKARIGTVDKFQGQEAPVVIYSMATSSPEDAPRGMEFLYSINRFNVATSRARCACFLVASPRLLEPECKTPHQMKLANALCRYLEMAERLQLGVLS